MERGDEEGKDTEISAAELKQKIEKLKERKGRYEELLKELRASGQSQVSLTDPESRAMALTPRGEVSYKRADGGGPKVSPDRGTGCHQ